MNSEPEGRPHEEKTADSGTAASGSQPCPAAAVLQGAAEQTGLPAAAAEAAPAGNQAAAELAEASPAQSESPLGQDELPGGEPILFPSFTSFPPPPPPPARIPNLGHLMLLVALLVMGLFVSTVLFFIAVHFHLFGAKTLEQAGGDIHYLLGSEGAIYLVTFGLSLLIFPLFWQESLFAGLRWNGAAALRLRWRLLGAALACLALAILSEKFMSNPADTPIEKVFRTPGARWLLFAFGVTFAPFFEEMFFRGFLLPAVATACDWIAEKINGGAQIPSSASGRPLWPFAANAVAAVILLSMPSAVFLAFYLRGRHGALWVLLPYSVALLTLIMILAALKTEPRAATHPVDASGEPLWSVSSMVVASVFTSLPFAAMHGQQTGYAFGPFLLLAGVSLVLCTVRLVTRSLAASTMVHASYNFILFLILAVVTSGFRHLDKM